MLYVSWSCHSCDHIWQNKVNCNAENGIAYQHTKVPSCWLLHSHIVSLLIRQLGRLIRCDRASHAICDRHFARSIFRGCLDDSDMQQGRSLARVSPSIYFSTSNRRRSVTFARPGRGECLSVQLIHPSLRIASVPF